MTAKLEVFYGSGHIADDATYEIVQTGATDDDNHIDMSGYAQVRPIITVGSVSATDEDKAIMEGLESLWQDYLSEWQVYVNEHFATGDGAPRPETAETGVKARFREILWQHPELTRPQAYMQAVMEIGDALIEAAMKRMDGKEREMMDDYPINE